MSKFAVILASHIPSVDKLWVGEDVLKKIKEFLPESDIFVGINPSSCIEEWVNIIKNHTDKYEVTPNELVVNSDASAYQTALKVYKKYKNEEYDLIWFLHTQGTKSNRHEVRNYHLNNLLINKNEVIEFFNLNEFNGGYSSNYSPAPWIYTDSNVEIENVLNKYFDFKYSCFRYITTGTMYVIKGKIVDNFLFNCKESFLNEPLSVYPDQKNTDLYFFERDFMQIVSRSGYIVGAKTYQNDYTIKIDKDIIDFYYENLNKWKLKNNLK